MEKNRLEKVRKHVFYKHTNIVIKKGGEKIAKKNFSKNTRIGYSKIVGKKSSEKSEKTCFFYENTNIVTKKWGEKNARKIFSRNTLISRVLKDGKNRLEKVRKHVFYKHMSIVT